MSILVIDKPSGPSSFGVVRRVRALLRGPQGKSGRLGHGGTLDPFASGVLPICIGEGTKVLPFLLDADKVYEATVRFGIETDTLDVTGRVVAERPIFDLRAEAIETALLRFRGTIAQVPPMFSALKRDGRPLYSYARAGQTLDRPARQVTIHALEMTAFEPPDRARLRIRCSKGTYIRALAADLGQHMGVGAHLEELRRTASGPFRIEQAITLDELAVRIAEGRTLPLLTDIEALAHLPKVAVDAEQGRVLSLGQRMEWSSLCQAREVEGPVCAVRVSDQEPALVAIVARDADGMVKILRGFGGR